MCDISQSSPRPSSPVNSPAGVVAASGRPSSPTPPGGPKTAIRRRAAADQKDKVANARPSSTRAAGAGGSSSTMLSELSLSWWVCVCARDGEMPRMIDSIWEVCAEKNMSGRRNWMGKLVLGICKDVNVLC